MKRKAQTDHKLVRQKWVKSFRKCRVYASVEIDPYHRIVTANIEISLRTFRKQSKSSISDVSAFRTSIEL